MTTSNDLDTVSHSWDGHFEQNGLPSQAQIQVAEASTAQKAAPAAAEPVPVDVGSGAPVKPEAPAEAKAPPAAAPHEYVADASHAVKLPANVSIDNIKVDGHNLVLEQADGSVIVIKDGALNVPTFIIGDVEVPRVALIAALEASHVDVAFGADGSMSAGPGGSTSSAGGNFEIPAGGIGDGFGLSALLPPTDLQFGLLEHRELFPGLVEKDSTISLTGTPPTLNVDESYLPDGSHTGPGSTTDTLSFANIFTVVPGSGTPTVSYALSVTTQGETSNLIDSATGQTVVLVLNGNTVEGHVGDAGGALVFTMSVNTATGAVILTQDRAVHQDDLSNTPDDAISLASNLVKLTATVTDPGGHTASASADIGGSASFHDDGPTANADTNGVAAGSHAEISGNVITGAGEAAGDADVKGADGASVTSASGVNAAQAVTAGGTTIQGAYGALTLHADGSYTYDRGTNTPGGVTDTFHYTLTDGDGDTSSSTLKIAIGQGTPELGPIPAEGSAGAIVYEAGLATIGSQAGNPSDPVTASGDIAFTSQDGVQKVMLGTHQLGEGVANAVTFTDPAAGGTVSAYYTYDGTSGGTIHYSYTLTAPYPSATAGDGTNIEATPNFAVVVTDLDNQTASGTLTIDVKDDTPTANADTNSVAAGSHAEITGNVITGAGEAAGDADVKGADGASVTSASGVNAAQTVTAGGTTIQGAYGVLTLHADGSYTYDRGTNTPGGVTDTFHYTLTDGDGDTSSTTLKIAIGQGTPELGPIPAEGSAGAIVYEAGLATIGSQAGNPSDPVTASGDIAFTSQDGVQKVMLGTHQLGEGVANAVTFTDPAAGGTVSAYYTYDGTSGGTIHYSYTLTAPYPSATAGDGTNIEATPNFAVVVTDLDNQTASGTLTIDVKDDTPTANADTNSVAAGSHAEITGNVITGAGEAAGDADVKGADGASVTSASGVDAAQTVTAGGTTIQGAYGVLTLHADGSYTYDRGTNTPGGVTDTFHYTLTDGDGDTSSTTLKIAIGQGTPELGPIPAEGSAGAIVYEAGLATIGSQAGNPSDPVTASGDIAFTSQDGVQKVMLGTHQLGEGVANAVTFTDPAAGGTVSAYYTYDGTSGGTIHYSYTLTAPYPSATAGDGTNIEATPNFDIAVTDMDNQTVTGNLTIDVIDDTPTAAPDTNSLTSGQTVTSNVESNDVFGADGKSGGVNGGVVGVATGTNTATALSTGVGAALTGSLGTLTLQANGSYSYVANPNVSGTDHFVYTIKDGDGNTSTTTLNITVNASGLAAGPDTVTVNEAGLASGSLHDGSNVTPSGTTLVGLVSGGVGADTYSLVGSATGTHGTIVINSDGTFTYTLTSPILAGTPTELADTFTYQVKDSVGNTITNTITVNALDDHPTATPDTNSLTSGQTVTSNVESNDVFGADGKSGGVNGGVVGVATGTDTATALSTGVGAALTGSLGTLTLQANGSYSYVANPNVSGTDHFVYTIKDGDGNTSTTTLNITVNASGLAAGPDTVTVNEAGLASGSLHDGSNVTPSGTTLVGLVSGGVGADTYSLVGSATGTHGTIVINSDGTFTYTLTSPILTGTPTELADTFTYQVKDSVGNTITNTITVNALDDHPTATPDTNSLTSGQTVTSNVESNDVFGADGKSGGVNGGVVGVATGTDTATALSTGVGAALTGSLGTLTLQANGSYSYVANPNVSGTDHFVYTIKDGDGNTSTTTLNITVNASGLAAGPDTVTVNEAGLASGSLHDGSNVTPSGTTLVGLVSGGVGADTYSLVGSATGTHGTIVINSDGTFTYTLTSPILAGTPTELADTFTYQVKDSVGNTITNTITVNALDDHPTATPDTNSLTSGQTVTSNVESNDVFGADGKSGGVNGGVVGVATGTDTATALSTGVGAALTGSLGTLTLQANGSYSYVANPNVSGTDHFVYTIKDGDGNTSTTTLNITVNASGLAAGPDTVTVNEAGLASGSLHDGSNVTPSGTTLVGLVSGGVGADTYSLVGSATGTHGTIVINSDGTFTYTLTSPILAGTPTELADTFTYQVKDSVGNTITNTITVNALDDHPTATPDTNSLTSGQTVTSNVESNDVFGADGKSGGVNGGVVGVATGTNTATALSTGVGAALTGSLGTLTLQANGSYSYVANPNVSGTDHFVYTIKDGDGNTSTTTLNITVNASGLAAGPDTVTVNEAGLASGSLHDGSNVTPSGTTLVGLVSGGVGADTYSLVGSATGTHGTIVINSDGTFTYTLTSPILTGTPTELADTFTYQVKDSVGNTITNTITVNALDDHPTATPDTNSLTSGQTVTSNVESNDVFGADGKSGGVNGGVVGVATGTDTATALSTGVGAALTGSLGTLTLQANGSYSYVANPNVSGTDHFVYTIKDGDGNTSTTTLNITVNASGLAAGPDTVTVNEAGLASGSLHDGSNVTPSGTTLVGLVSGGVGADTYSLVGSATGTHGTIVINSDGTFTYTLTSPILTGTPTELADTFTYQVKDSVGNTITNTITVNALDDVPQILSIQNAVMPNVSNTDAHGSWQPVFGADGLSSTAIGIAMGTAPAGETYSFSNNVGTSASSEQINKVTVTPTTGAAYTFYEYTHYDATTHSSEMFAYQTLAGAQSGLASDQFFTLTMATDGTYDFHLASNQLQASVSTDLTSISAGHSGWAEVNGTTSSTGSGTPPSGYDILIQGGTNYIVASGAFTLGYVNSNNHSFGINNANFDNAEVVGFKFGTAQTYASFGVYSPASTDSFQIYIWDSSHTHSLTETLTGNAATFIVDAAHWTGTGANNLAAFNSFVATYGGFSEMDAVNTGTTVGLTSISYNEKVTVTDTSLTFAPTITDGDGDTASYGSNLSVSLVGTHTAPGYQLSGTNDVFAASATGHDSFAATGTNDTVDFSNAAGSVQVNLLTHIYGGAATGDTLTGIENLIGSSHGGDVLVGDNNSNTLIAGNGAGLTTMTGGGGADTFVINAAALSGTVHDLITDYHSGENDVVDLSKVLDAVFGGNQTSAEALGSLTVTKDATSVHIDVTHGGSPVEVATLTGISSTINIVYDDAHHAASVPVA